MTARAVALLALALAACGDAAPDTRVPCTSQLVCSKEFNKVCEAGFCSPKLPDAAFETLKLDITSLRLANAQSFEVAIAYAITPDSKTLTCATIPSMAVLKDPTKFNLTASPSTSQMPQGDVVTFAAFVSGVGRVVYVEAYAETKGELQTSPTRTVVGAGCLDDAPYGEGQVIGLKLKPKS